jgi:orotate phosphoribosyltransferase
VEPHTIELVELMARCGALSFGDFVAKSGRKTPYFVNTGRFRNGADITALGRLYAREAVARFGDGFDVLFGPAYKGIPLVIATATALFTEHGRNVAYCFNRKEAKDHGEGGALLGHTLRDGDRVLILEDVTTAGTSIRETVPMLQAAARVRLTGLLVAVDRMERGTGERNALSELGEQLQMQACALVTVREIMQYLRGRTIGGEVLLTEALHARMLEYLAAHEGAP